VELAMEQNSAVMEQQPPAEVLMDQIVVALVYVHPRLTAAVAAAKMAAVQQAATLFQLAELMVHVVLLPLTTVRVRTQGDLVVVLVPAATVAITLTTVAAVAAVVGMAVVLVVQTGHPAVAGDPLISDR
jgi:hypothetical protein